MGVLNFIKMMDHINSMENYLFKKKFSLNQYLQILNCKIKRLSF